MKKNEKKLVYLPSNTEKEQMKMTKKDIDALSDKEIVDGLMLRLAELYWEKRDFPNAQACYTEALAHRYMGTPDINYANGLLLYEEWPNLRIHYDNSGAASTEMETDWFKLRGEAILDSFPIYLNDLFLLYFARICSPRCPNLHRTDIRAHSLYLFYAEDTIYYQA